MSEIANLVFEFHLVFNLPMCILPTSPEELPNYLIKLRLDLITEKLNELKDSDTVVIADALADIMYVTNRTAISFGIDLDALYREIHKL